MTKDLALVWVFSSEEEGHYQNLEKKTKKLLEVKMGEGEDFSSELVDVGRANGCSLSLALPVAIFVFSGAVLKKDDHTPHRERIERCLDKQKSKWSCRFSSIGCLIYPDPQEKNFKPKDIVPPQCDFWKLMPKAQEEQTEAQELVEEIFVLQSQLWRLQGLSCSNRLLLLLSVATLVVIAGLISRILGIALIGLVGGGISSFYCYWRCESAKIKIDLLQKSR